MYKQKSVVSSYFYSFSIVFTLFILISGGIWVYQELEKYNKEFNNIRNEYADSKRKLIKDEVEKIVTHIQYQKSIAEKRLKNNVKARTYEAYDMAMNIYRQNKSKKSLTEIKQLVHDALFSVAWDNGRGYYFAEDMDGNEIINRNNPELEGKNLSHFKDSKGTVIMDAILAAANNDKGEGFCRYYWNKPDTPDVLIPKISFIKYFKPFDWVIGTGKYLSVEEEIIQQEILEQVGNFTYGEDGYVFIGTWDGLILSEPAKGKNLIGLKDVNGVRIVSELIDKAKVDGGFVHYVMPPLGGKAPLPKISYAKGIKDWEWFVGTGLYVNEIETIIKEKQAALHKDISLKLFQGIFVLLMIVSVAFLFARVFANRVKRNLTLFKSFFDNAAVSDAVIDIDKTYFSEFHSMAESANQMIAQRQRVREKLETNETRFQNILRNTHISIMITSIENDINYLNLEFTSFFGYTKNEVKTIDDFINKVCLNPKKRETIQEEWKLLTAADKMLSDSRYGFIWELETRDKLIKTVECCYTPVDENEGLYTFTDLTKLKNAEKEKLQLEIQLMQSQKMEAIGLMAGVIAYPELLMLQLPQDDPMQASLQTILKSGKRAAEVVADLLTIARGVKNTKSPANLNTLITDYLTSPEHYAILSNHSGVSINFLPDNKLLSINCSEIHIKKCIMNIISNGAEAIPGSGIITISTENRYIDKPSADNLQIIKGEYVIVKVKDSGTGISGDDIDRIFEPFYTKKVMGRSGTGLGLAVVWNTMVDHGGGIKVHSDSGGTTFDLYFPITRNTVKTPEDEVKIDGIKGNKESVLIIDDEPMQQDIASLYLKALNYNPITVSSGEEAIDYLQKNSVDILLLDMIMDPGINGRLTYEKIAEIHPGQKAVIASGYSESEEVKKLNELGVTTYIKKPYLLNQIGGALKMTLYPDIEQTY